ncbi:MAG: YciI family protein [Mesorhizobium sp.]
MQYMLLIHVDEAAMAAAAPTASPDKAYAMAEPFMAYNEALKKAGAWVAGDRLAPSSSTTRVRMLGDRTEVLDGPFADTKEQLGGYYIIEAQDLDAAIQWAARCPAAQNRAVEVRPIWKAQ